MVRHQPALHSHLGKRKVSGPTRATRDASKAAFLAVRCLSIKSPQTALSEVLAHSALKGRA